MFINRVDDIVEFRELSEDDLAAIVRIQLGHLKERLAEKRIAIDVTDDAMAVLAREGYDPAFGARPLKRVIQKELGDPLAMAILEGEFSEGDTVMVSTDGEGSLVVG